MVDAFKKLDKKFLIFAGCIIFIPLAVILFLVLIQSCSGDSKVTYEEYEKKMIAAAEKYFEGSLPTEEGEMLEVELEALVNKGYIKSTEKLVDDTCTGRVRVRRNGSSVETNNGGFLNYTVDLDCKNYKTVHIIDKITSEVVTSESGLYKTDDGYIFKGNKVNNYISLFDQNYRIVSIDKNGIIKLIKEESENLSRRWDSKFNVEANRSYGKNIYKDSEMLGFLLLDYENPKKIRTESKAHIVAYDVCIGKRGISDATISHATDCSERIEKQVISTMNVSDFALASTDPDCKDLNSRACINYNYLTNVASTSWTMNAVNDNTYQVLLISDGLYEAQNANLSTTYNIVIYIDGDELYISGEGSQTNPYVIE